MNVDDTNPVIELPQEDFEIRIQGLSNEKFRGRLYRDGLPFGAPSGQLTREGIFAWVGLVTGTYADTFTGEAK